jgi:hypothetical protein
VAAQSGRSAGELGQDGVTGMFDELAGTRQMLDRRYVEIESGEVKLVPGDEVSPGCACFCPESMGPTLFLSVQSHP